MIKLPSVDYLVKAALHTCVRFPSTLLVAIAGTVAALMLIEIDEYKDTLLDEYLVRFLVSCALGLPLTISFTLYAEKKKWKYPSILAVQGFALMLLATYFWSLPESFPQVASKHFQRFLLLNLGLHFLVAFSPFVTRGELNGFWQFNKALFLRFLTAVLYSGVLFTGLSVALLAVDNLFGVTIEFKVYLQLWVVISGVFNTAFFLAGVPEPLDALEQQTDYPVGLKKFTQYVLLPLVVIYLAILYAYTVKILLAASLPEGWVSNLILSFSVFGILALLLVHPIREEADNKWIQTFGRWFYLALVPLVVLLFAAIGKRISDYGVTELRYYVAVLAIWLAGITTYFLLSRQKNIKLIPISLCLISLLVTVGPWSAFQVSKRSQLQRLTTLFEKHGIWKDETIHQASADLPFKDKRDISSIVTYLCRHHGPLPIQQTYGIRLDTMPDNRNDFYNKVMDVIGVEHVSSLYHKQDEMTNFRFYPASDPVWRISGYDYLVSFNLHASNNDTATQLYTWDTLDYRLKLDTRTNQLMGYKQGVQDFAISLESLVEHLLEHYTDEMSRRVPHRELRIETEQKMLLIKQLNGKKMQDTLTLTGVQGAVLLSDTEKDE